jgi:hypothetical protein
MGMSIRMIVAATLAGSVALSLGAHAGGGSSSAGRSSAGLDNVCVSWIIQRTDESLDVAAKAGDFRRRQIAGRQGDLPCINCLDANELATGR